MSFLSRVKEKSSVNASKSFRKPPCYASMMASIPSSYCRDPYWGEPPEADLEPHFVYGYRSFGQARNNQFISADGRLVFHSAAIAVVYDTENNAQTFFAEHEDDIWSLAIHPNGRIAATGQAGRKPEIHIWDIENKERLMTLQGFFERQVIALDFSPDGKYLVGLGGDDNNSVAVYDWEKEILVASCKGDSNKVFAIRWDPYNTSNIICTGIRSIRVFTFQPFPTAQLSSKRGVFGKAPPQNVLSIAFHPELGIVTGCQTGEVMVWAGSVLDRFIPAHRGQSHAVEVFLDGRILSGGDDGKLIMWDSSLSMHLCELDLPGKQIKSIAVPKYEHLDQDVFYLGCGTGETFKVVFRNGEMVPQLLMESHRGTDNELWGIAPHPKLPHGFVTGCDDGTVRIWDGLNHTCVKKIAVKGKARSVDISPDGSLIAVGHFNGKVELYTAESGELVWENNDRDEWIASVKFSPDGTKLASGSHTNHIDVWVLTSNGMKKRGTCLGHSSYITHVDWSADSKLLQTNSGDYEMLYWDTNTVERGLISRVTSPSSMQDVQWHHWTCKFGWWVEGVFPEGADFTDVNCAAVSNDKTLVVTGDDDRDVKLYRCPALSLGAIKPTPKTYFGHSEHVTGVVFTDSDEFVVTIGGGDKTIIQWKIVNRPTFPPGYELPAWQIPNDPVIPSSSLPSTSKPQPAGEMTPRSRSGSVDLGSGLNSARSSIIDEPQQKMLASQYFEGFKRPSTPSKPPTAPKYGQQQKDKKGELDHPPMVFTSAPSFVSSTKSTKYVPSWKGGSGGGGGGMSSRPTPHPLGGSLMSARPPTGHSARPMSARAPSPSPSARAPSMGGGMASARPSMSARSGSFGGPVSATPRTGRTESMTSRTMTTSYRSASTSRIF